MQHPNADSPLPADGAWVGLVIDDGLSLALAVRHTAAF